MTDFTKKSFTVAAPPTEQYRTAHEAALGKRCAICPKPVIKDSNYCGRHTEARACPRCGGGMGAPESLKANLCGHCRAESL